MDPNFAGAVDLSALKNKKPDDDKPVITDAMALAWRRDMKRAFKGILTHAERVRFLNQARRRHEP